MATTQTTPRPLTANQSSYLRSLVERISNDAVKAAIKADLNTLLQNRLLTVQEASRQIDRIKAVVAAQQVAAAAPAPVVAPAPAPVAQPARLPFPVVAAGRYAVEVDGVLRFYNVTKTATGRTEAKRYVSDALTSIRMGEVVRALRLIEADPETARMTYARETTRCFTCGRRLTDPESMERGQGPDCAGR